MRKNSEPEHILDEDLGTISGVGPHSTLQDKPSSAMQSLSNIQNAKTSDPDRTGFDAITLEHGYIVTQDLQDWIIKKGRPV